MICKNPVSIRVADAGLRQDDWRHEAGWPCAESNDQEDLQSDVDPAVRAALGGAVAIDQAHEELVGVPVGLEGGCKSWLRSFERNPGLR